MSYRTHTGARRGERSAFALLGRRIAAYLLDMLILFGVLAPAGQLILWLLDATPPQTGPMIARVILWNFSLPAWLYFVLSDRSASGATLGKRLLKIQVRDVSGERLSIRARSGTNGRQAPALGACACVSIRALDRPYSVQPGTGHRRRRGERADGRVPGCRRRDHGPAQRALLCGGHARPFGGGR